MAGPATWSEFITQINAILDNFALTVGEDVVSSNVISSTDFTKATGAYLASPTSPWASNTIPLNKTGSVRGGISVVWYKGSVLTVDSFTGGDVVIFSGENNVNELCRVHIDYDKQANAFCVNIQTGFTGDIPSTDPAPNQMEITNVFDSGDDGVSPNQMEITNVSEFGDSTSPATMEITNLT